MQRLMKDACVVAGAAAFTAACVLAVAGPRVAVAEGEAKATPVTRPVLKAEGVVLSLVTDKAKYEPGEKPTLTLTMVNTRDIDVSLEAVLTMLSTEPASWGSRRMPRPTEAWRRECALKLAPGETKEFEIATDKALAAGLAVMFNLQVGKNTLTAARLTVPGAGAEAAPRVRKSATEEELLKRLIAAAAPKAGKSESPSAPDGQKESE